jgi:hypothetical protein
MGRNIEARVATVAIAIEIRIVDRKRFQMISFSIFLLIFSTSPLIAPFPIPRSENEDSKLIFESSRNIPNLLDPDRFSTIGKEIKLSDTVTSRAKTKSLLKRVN